MFFFFLNNFFRPNTLNPGVQHGCAKDFGVSVLLREHIMQNYKKLMKWSRQYVEIFYFIYLIYI